MPPGRIDGGRALFDGRDLLQLGESELRKIRGRDIAMIFQDPMTCLNPYMTIGKQLMEPLLLPPQGERRSRPAAGRWNCWRKWVYATPNPPSTTIRTSSPAACGSG